MMTLILLGAVVLLLTVNAVQVYRNRLQAARHVRELAEAMNESLRQSQAHRQRLDADLSTVAEKHRAETITERVGLAGRGDFDNDWGGLSDETAGRGASDSATADTGSPGTAQD